MNNIKSKGIIVILICYLFLKISISIYNNPIFTNIVNPLFWGILLAFMIYDIKRHNIKSSVNKRLYFFIFFISSIEQIIYFYIGVHFGFGKSPYSHSVLSIIENSIIQILPIIGVEIARFLILTKNKNNKILRILLTILLIIIEINYTDLVYSNREEVFRYICSVILPIIANNMLCTYLSLNGSYILNLIYRILGSVILILAPIVPNVNWFLTGSTGILFPAIIYFIFRYEFVRSKKSTMKTNLEKISYSISFLMLSLIVLFFVGVFKYEPIAILSNSMFETFEKGDVVIFKKVSDDELRKIPQNAIIVYSIQNQNIVHRVVNRIEDNGNVMYQTKGDNNNCADPELVSVNQIKGIYVFHLKYLGFPTIWLYNYIL